MRFGSVRIERQRFFDRHLSVEIQLFLPCAGREVIMMFAGLMSRWIICCACASANAAAICCASARLCSTLNRSRLSLSASVSPSTSSRATWCAPRKNSFPVGVRLPKLYERKAATQKPKCSMQKNRKIFQAGWQLCWQKRACMSGREIKEAIVRYLQCPPFQECCGLGHIE